MTQEFVPYRQALALKELGFDQPCICGYSKITRNLDTYSGFLVTKDSFTVDAPTLSQAFRFFREKYNLRHNIGDFINDETGIEWDYEIAVIGTDLDEGGNYKPLVEYSTNDENRKFKTYEEAELSCLIKLIEIVKEKI